MDQRPEMVPESARRPGPAAMVAFLCAWLVIVQTWPAREWATAGWSGTVVFCVLVAGRPGSFLEKHLATRRLSALGMLLSMGFLMSVDAIGPTGEVTASPIPGFMIGLWHGRWLTRREVTDHPFGWNVGVALAFGFGYAVLTGPDPRWARVGAVVLGMWLFQAALYSGFARSVRLLQDRLSTRLLVLLGVATLLGGIALPSPSNRPEIFLALAAMGMWFGRWFLADPAIDAAPDPAPGDAAGAPA